MIRSRREDQRGPAAGLFVPDLRVKGNPDDIAPI